ncbi:MAG: glutamate racemase [Tissierellales bacterium]|jgi:glutamate racemase|nr:glutamate racemase [Tissierellales bacterium]
MNTKPIGVFDSGIGGLTVLKELISLLPNEDFIYFGDTARIPYGTRSKETVKRYTFECLDFLVERGVKALVIACNSATASALEEAKERYDVPVFGVIEPGARAAVKVSKNGKIGVIATRRTINSGEYQKKILMLDSNIEIVGKACPLFVQIAEEGWGDSDVAYLTAKKYLMDIKDYEIDTLVLGCTHYPILRYTIEKVVGDGVRLVSPAFETSKQLKGYLKDEEWLNEQKGLGSLNFFVSDDVENFKSVGQTFLQKTIECIKEVHHNKGIFQELDSGRTTDETC